jgi:membrane-bound metal-dependent hydrolase YbcI (DUF457 family)
MKGIAHFVTGVAVATFFPEIVHGAAQSTSLGPLLGGLAGLLPDTLDFKFVRYFFSIDEEIDPAKITTAAGYPDPQAMAKRIAAAMNRVHETGKQARVQLHTLRLGTDLWRQYSVAFDLALDQILVRIGPVVTTGQVPYPDSEVPGVEPARAQVHGRILHTYDAEITIDVFSGPSMSFEKVGDAVRVTFMPWHRNWTHSLVAVLLLGVLGALIAPVYGVALALAALLHVMADHMGFMGSNLFFPITRERTMGWKLMRSGDAIPNFLLVWVSLACIFLNLDRFSEAPAIPVWPYVLGVIVLPGLFLVGLHVLDGVRRQHRSTAVSRRLKPSVMAAVEALDETSEVDI